MDLDWSRFNQFKKDIKGKRVLILGLGLQGGGVGAAHFFSKMGAKLRISDLKTEVELAESLEKIKDIKIEKLTLGGHETADVDTVDLILLNPDIPHDASILQYVRVRNKEIQMEEALFMQLCPTQDVVGVTGTRGKTTTTMLIFELLKTTYPVFLGGNVSGSETLMRLFDNFDDKTKVVLELSSFQLYGFHLNKISPHLSVWTNIYEDHLNKYRSMKDYIFDKQAIYQYQNENDYFIRNESLRYHELIHDSRGKNLFFSPHNVEHYEKKLKGEHNDENYAASLAAAKIFNVSEENIQKVFSTFNGVPFRQEEIAEINGVSFVNDTTATTPKAAVVAIDAYKSRSIILLAGGNSKNCSIQEFAKVAAANSKKIILLKGNASEDFRKALLEFIDDETKVSEIFEDFRAAIQFAYQSARSGDVVLLSPGFTSFGMFKNEFDRGRQFNKIVSELKLER